MAKTLNNLIAAEFCSKEIRNFDAVHLAIRRCPPVGSLKKINDSLNQLTAQSNGSVSEIAEVISRDMSMTARLLRLVNSVFSGLTVHVTSVEEAIFYLGLRQIRQLALTTRIVDEVQKIGDDGSEVDWAQFWRHSIGCGILSREILSMASGSMDDDVYYISGLLQDVGKLVMFNVFPDELAQRQALVADSREELALKEYELYGWNQAQIGALYLESNNMPKSIVEAVLFQFEPSRAPSGSKLAAGVQVAESIARYGGCIASFEDVKDVEYEDWEKLAGWDILFGAGKAERQYARASILSCVERLPTILKGLL